MRRRYSLMPTRLSWVRIDALLHFAESDEFHATRVSPLDNNNEGHSWKRSKVWRMLDQQEFAADWYQELINDALQPRPAINTACLHSVGRLR